MGRKKIKIQPIKEDRNRSVTYLKRKAGLFKKAHELAVLTDSQVAVIVFGHNGKLAEFCSTDIDLLLLRYTDGANSSRGAGGRASGSGSNSRSVSGVKRKAEQSSPPRNTHLSNSTVLAGAPGTSSTAKQTINAAIRQKNHNRSPANPALAGHIANQNAFDPPPFGQAFMAGSNMPHSMVGAPLSNMGAMVPTSALASVQGAGNVPSINPTRAETIASMSIPMPANDRLSMFVSPATPGFGLTPGGSVITPGGRRFSFSDVLTRGSGSAIMQRPVTANSLMPSTFFQNDAFRLAAPTQPHAFNSVSPNMSPQPPQGKPASTAASDASRNGIALAASPNLFSDFRPSAALVSRPASTGEKRSGVPIYNDTTFASSSGAANTSANVMAPAANIVRPFTAAANLELPNTSTNHLALPVANFHASSASPVPHTSNTVWRLADELSNA
ncbi:hypothetical protein [Sporisorium scitamineum]|uniref:MADS-box domain-containing protein n=1 Tax=Sporisorium scitamineum TaxID=49012 RepID=A0A0F7S269_9BASI|nr:hypothetical protein [Sporisorium scitamineum]